MMRWTKQIESRRGIENLKKDLNDFNYKINKLTAKQTLFLYGYLQINKHIDLIVVWEIAEV